MSSRFLRLGMFALALSGLLSAQTTAKSGMNSGRASRQEVRALRDLVEAQQKQIEAQGREMQELRDEVRRVLDAVQRANAGAQNDESKATQAQAAAEHAERSAQHAETSAEQASSGVSEARAASAKADEELGKRVQSVENGVKKIGPFALSGDLRLRDEPFFGGPADHSQVRNRMRFRLRVNANAKLNDEINGGFALASGDINDAISSNQTTNQFYTRKAISIDKAFLDYNPRFFKPLTLTGGKFAYPWYNTELVWDKDLNPEGLAQTLAFNLDSTPLLKRVALVGFELPFAEVARTDATNKSIVQSMVYGAQLQTSWQLAGWLKFGAYSGFYNYHDADPIAVAEAKASLKNPTTPLGGALPLGGSALQNSILTTTANGIVTVNGQPISTGVKTITDAQFASKFGLLDLLARFDIQTAYERLPITLIGDYVQNTRACANLQQIRPAPANTPTATFSQSLSVPCDSRQRRGYWAEARFGRLRDKGDWQFAYTRAFIEREAVMSAFNASDIRQGSNVSQHRVEMFYQAHSNVQLGFTGFFGRPLNLGKSTPPEDLLQRYQFDVVYKF
ncbi:MAG TPA: putative porin [Terriglobales bacterium]|nr:putative porin [Terriglobales bacterium]